MKNNTSKKIIFSVLVLAVILTVNTILLININSHKEGIIEIKKNIIIESSRSASLNDTKKKIEELKKIGGRINNILINESNAVAFISLIEEIALQSGSEIQIGSVNFEDPEEEGQLGVLDLKFKVNGGWTEVTAFLNSIESLPYLININSIRLSVFQSEEGARWSVDFGLVGLTN